MNIDTDTQYAFTRPIVDHMFTTTPASSRSTVTWAQEAVRPRAYGKAAEAGMAARIVEACEDLRSTGTRLT